MRKKAYKYKNMAQVYRTTIYVFGNVAMAKRKNFPLPAMEAHINLMLENAKILQSLIENFQRFYGTNLFVDYAYKDCKDCVSNLTDLAASQDCLGKKNER